MLSQRSLALLRPTIRAKGSQIWASWNPRRKGDAIDDFFRVRRPRDAAVVEVNWRDNPWFPAVLEEERLTDLKLYPDRYDHVWEGGYLQLPFHRQSVTRYRTWREDPDRFDPHGLFRGADDPGAGAGQ